MPIRSHHVKSDQLKEICPYCGKSLNKANDWRSEFHIDMHYKKLVCSCGKENIVKVDFLGSGHDDWSGKLDLNTLPGSDRPDEEAADDFDQLVNQEHDDVLGADIETEEDSEEDD